MPMKKGPSTSWKIIFILTCIVFSISLFGYVLIGTTSRYLQDDYCYAALLRGKNFWTEQISSYLHETTYSGERISLTFGMALSGLAGPVNVRLLPGIMLAAWLVGLYLTIKLAPWLSGLGLNRLETVLMAEAIALFTLSMAPNWVQSFFWRPGMFPYFAPLVSGTFLGLVMLSAMRRTRWKAWLLIGVFLLSFLTGGFSETSVAVEISFLLIFFGITCFSKEDKWLRLLPIMIAIAGSIAAFVLLMSSPANAIRLSRSYGATSNLQSVLINSLESGLYFYKATAYRPTLLYTSALLFFGLMGLTISSRLESPSISLKQLILGWGIFCGLAYMLTAASLAPNFYVESSYPGDRALIIPRFVSICLAAAVGYLTGNYLSGWVKNRWLLNLVVLAGVVIVFVDGMWLLGMDQFFYPPAYPDMRSFLKLHVWFGLVLILASAVLFIIILWKAKIKVTLTALLIVYLLQPALMGARIFTEYPILQHRAVLVDRRESQIILARDSGVNNITVQSLNNLVGIGDLSDNSGFWVNNCVAMYYRVNSIRAVGPLLDPIHLENP
jgi:hypothetical protein